MSIFARVGVGLGSKRVSTRSAEVFERGLAECAVVWNEPVYFNLSISDLNYHSTLSPVLDITLFLSSSVLSSPVKIGHATIPFIHLNGRMEEQQIDVVLTSPCSKEHKTQRAKLLCTVQWVQSVCQADFDAAMLHHTVEKTSATQAGVANQLHEEAFSVITSNSNAQRFVVSAADLWTFIDVILSVLTWQKPSISASLLVVWSTVCFYGVFNIAAGTLGLLLVISLFMNPLCFLPPIAENKPYVPRSLRPMSMSRKLRSAQAIQNFMRIHSDCFDGLFYFFEVGLQQDYVQRYVHVALVGAFPIYCIVSMYVPLNIVLLLAGWIFLLVGNPYVQGILSVLLLKGHRYYLGRGERAQQEKNVQILHKHGDIVAYEYSRWWVGAGWKVMHYDPGPLESITPPAGSGWHGLWQVTMFSGEHENSEYEYSSGLPNAVFHPDRRLSDFVRRKQWTRGTRNLVNEKSTTRRARLEDASALETDGTAVVIEVYENERWWVGTGFIKKFWPHENIFKFTDPATGFERGKDFYDSCEAVLQADGSSRWIDEWHVDGGWEYANDFKNGNFICKIHPGGLDFVRRRKWVRKLLVAEN